MNKPKITKQITPLAETLHACKVIAKFMLIFGCIANILMLATPLYSMQVLDRVISSGNTNTLVMLSLVIAAAIMLLALIQGARSLAMVKMGNWIEERLSHLVFENSIHFALEQRKGNGSLQMRDLQTIKTYLTSPQLISMLDIPWALIFILVLFILHTYFGVIALLGCVFLIGMGLLSDRLTRPLHDANNESFVKSMNQVEQATRNAEVVSVMGLSSNIIDSWRNLNNKVQNNQTLAARRQGILSEFSNFFRTLLQISVTGIGAYLVIRGDITPGVIIASSSLVGRALAPFQAAIASWKNFAKFLKSYQRLENAFAACATKYSQDAMSLPEPLGQLTVQNLYYVPAGAQKHILKGINFKLEPGEVLVIIGPSGSGKTTLAKALVGAITPSVGTIRLDNASLKDWNHKELGQYLGYLPQDVELFMGSVKQNIGRMQRNPDAAKVVEAAQTSGVHSMILQLTKGYNTEIGMDGSLLSAGQRQRIGLARAFFGNPKLLVLDEPNSNLDTAGEQALASAIEAARKQKITTIIISHRHNILNLSDKIMVMHEGSVASFGTKKEILEHLTKAVKEAPGVKKLITPKPQGQS